MSNIVLSSKTKSEHWRDLILKQEASGQSIRTFCDERGINHHTFRYWRGKIWHDPQKKTVKTVRRRFITIADATFKPAVPKIVLPNGVTIDLGSGLDSGSINQFLLKLCGVGLPQEGGPHAKS